MELRARIRHFARPAAITAALGALLVPAFAGTATADAAKRKSKRYPVVTSVRPMDVKVGERITVLGRNFKRGKNKNTVVFKRDGARAVFVKTTLSTARQISVVVPETLRQFLPDNTSARFRLRVLSERFSKKFTSNSKSPTITALPKPVASAPGAAPAPGSPGSPAPAPAPAPAPVQVCRADEDRDLLDAATEDNLGLDACNADSDGDGVPDGYEVQSARDLNDDEFQDPNTYLPFPGKRPYPNALDKDADVDHDGDSLTLLEEYRLWQRFGFTGSLAGLLYSAGEAYSLSVRDGSGRRRPTQPATGYDKHADFKAWSEGNGYRRPMLSIAYPWHDAGQQIRFWLFDFNRSSGDYDRSGAPDGPEDAVLPGVNYSTASGYLRPEVNYFDLDKDAYVSDDERDEDADGLTNYDEAHGRMTAGYWEGCYALEKAYKVVYAGTDLANGDTDGDGVRDGADDQDHDDIPNVMEMSRNAASGHVDWDPQKGTCHPNDDLLNPDDGDADTQPESKLEELHPTDYGRVNPFNPCLPYDWSRTCDRHPGLNGASAPFDGSPNWFSLQ